MSHMCIPQKLKGVLLRNLQYIIFISGLNYWTLYWCNQNSEFVTSKWKFIKGHNAYFRYVLQPCVLYLGGEVFGLSDKNEVFTLYNQNGTYNETVYILPSRFFLPKCFALIKILQVTGWALWCPLNAPILYT